MASATRLAIVLVLCFSLTSCVTVAMPFAVGGTEPSRGDEVAMVALLPLTLAIDVVTLPVQVVGFAIWTISQSSSQVAIRETDQPPSPQSASPRSRPAASGADAAVTTTH